MSTFALDDIRTAAKKKFEPVTVQIDEDTEISLPPILRLSKTDREAVADILKDLRGLDEDADDDESTLLVVDTIGELFQRLSPKARKLVKAIEDEEPDVQLLILTEILNAWFERTQPGEA